MWPRAEGIPRRVRTPVWKSDRGNRAEIVLIHPALSTARGQGFESPAFVGLSSSEAYALPRAGARRCRWLATADQRRVATPNRGDGRLQIQTQTGRCCRPRQKQAAKDLKGARFVLWKNARRLTDRQRHKLAQIQQTNQQAALPRVPDLPAAGSSGVARFHGACKSIVYPPGWARRPRPS